MSSDLPTFIRLARIGIFLDSECGLTVQRVERGCTGEISLVVYGAHLRYGLVADPAFDLLRLSVSSLDRPEGEPGRRIVDAKLDEGGLALAQRLVVALESDCFDVDAHPLVLGGGEGEWGWVIE